MSSEAGEIGLQRVSAEEARAETAVDIWVSSVEIGGCGEGSTCDWSMGKDSD